MKYICEDCGTIFDEDDVGLIEQPTEYDNGVDGAWYDRVCPECGSEDFYKYREPEEEEGEEEE